jgi:hypothetical protein
MTKAKQDKPELTEESLHNLVEYVNLLIEMDQAEKAREARLVDELKGYAIIAEGQTCHGCGASIFHEEMWYDKWGVKCLKCQDALNKKVVPGFVFKDYKNEKSVNISDLSFKTGMHQQTLKKLVRQGKLRARHYKGDRGELWMFLRKENLNLLDMLDDERAEQTLKLSSK